MAIDTDYVRPLMDASHLVVGDGRAAFVDTGTTHSVPNLLAALDEKGLDREAVDYVLLTHIHLDHAGGAGALMRELPNATAVVHPRGAAHMVAPEKLIAGTRAVYGDEIYAQLYGEILPIDEGRVRTVEDGERLMIGDRPLEFIHTPGHALHHYCIVDLDFDGIFSGDTFGVSYRETDTAKGEFIIPTTTPTHFDPVAAHRSIDRIMGYAPRAIYLTHYSRVTDLDRLADDLHDALDEHVAIAKRYADDVDRVAKMQQAIFESIDRRLDAHGYEPDADARAAVFQADVMLNAQGLDAWLRRLEKERGRGGR